MPDRPLGEAGTAARSASPLPASVAPAPDGTARQADSANTRARAARWLHPDTRVEAEKGLVPPDAALAAR